MSKKGIDISVWNKINTCSFAGASIIHLYSFNESQSSARYTRR